MTDVHSASQEDINIFSEVMKGSDSSQRVWVVVDIQTCDEQLCINLPGQRVQSIPTSSRWHQQSSLPAFAMHMPTMPESVVPRSPSRSGRQSEMMPECSHKRIHCVKWISIVTGVGQKMTMEGGKARIIALRLWDAFLERPVV